MPGPQLKPGQAAAAMVCMCAGNTFALVCESKQLMEISNALMKMLARSAGQNAVQLGLYATVSSARLSTNVSLPLCSGATGACLQLHVYMRHLCICTATCAAPKAECLASEHGELTEDFRT